MTGRYRAVILEELPFIVVTLANDINLPDKYQDHPLTGNWEGHNECHIRPDLLLIYMKIGDTTNAEDKSGELRLVRLGSHSELF